MRGSELLPERTRASSASGRGTPAQVDVDLGTGSGPETADGVGTTARRVPRRSARLSDPVAPSLVASYHTPTIFFTAPQLSGSVDIRELTEESERREAVPILRQLWSDTAPDDVLEWTADDEYHLFGGFVDGSLVGVAGVLVQHVLHHTRHAWLYDLVVDESRRERGHGTRLVEFVEEWAEENGCESVALASPLAKAEVQQYYDNRNYETWGYIIEKRL